MSGRPVLHALCVVAALVCGAGAQAPSGLVAVLLAEGKIVLVDVATGGTVADFAAASPPPGGMTLGSLSQSGDDVLAVLPGAEAPMLSAIDVRARKGRTIARLPADRYPGLA